MKNNKKGFMNIILVVVIFVYEFGDAGPKLYG